jgi:hypothetical protein
MALFGNGNGKKKTVAGITESLTRIKTDLQILEQETAEELEQYNLEQMALQLKIEGAKSEKSKGFTIFKNISALLGEPVEEEAV